MVTGSDAFDQGQRQTLLELPRQGREQTYDFRTSVIRGLSLVFPWCMLYKPLLFLLAS